MKLPCRLTKIKSTHSNLRTDVIVGFCLGAPKMGESFTMFAPPLVTQADLRVITTTEVQAIAQIGQTYDFNTMNSTYKLELL